MIAKVCVLHTFWMEKERIIPLFYKNMKLHEEDEMWEQDNNSKI